MKHRRLPTAFTVLAVGAALALPQGLQAQDPYIQADDTWITIDGMVEQVSMDSFVLDYGPGVITVEMDDGDRDADGYKLEIGDQVSVTGLVDDDWLELATIEASSVYVENAGTYYFASAIDEEGGFDPFITVPSPIDQGHIFIQGYVTWVDEDEFVVNSGTRSITVATDAMSYDPLDEEGYQKIEMGDWVTVSGYIDADLLEGPEVRAETITTLWMGS